MLQSEVVIIQNEYYVSFEVNNEHILCVWYTVKQCYFTVTYSTFYSVI